MTEPSTFVDVLRGLLSLAAGLTLPPLLWLLWRERLQPVMYAHLALAVSLALFAFDSAQRIGRPFVPYLLEARAAVVACTVLYLVARLRAERPTR